MSKTIATKEWYINKAIKKHGKFRIRPDNHLTGGGCPICNESKGEKKVASFLDKLSISYIREYKIEGYNYRYDFYISNLNIMVEYDGIQHFKPIEIWGGIDNLNRIKKTDKAKEVICKKNGILLIRIPYTAFDNLY